MYKKITILLIILILVLTGTFFSLKNIQAAPTGNYLVVNGGTVSASNSYSSAITAFTFEAWIKPTAVTGVKNILTAGDNTSNSANYQIGINGGGLSFLYRFNNSSLSSIVTGNLQPGVWQNIKVSVDSESTKLFINGVQIANRQGAVNLNAFGPNIILGGGGNNSSNYFGEIDDVVISVNNNPFINWKFDQVRSETSAVDSSGNLINGTLTGGDSKIHFFGSLPTPTKFVLPTLAPIRRITFAPRQPTGQSPQPTSVFNFDFDRTRRPQIPR